MLLGHGMGLGLLLSSSSSSCTLLPDTSLVDLNPRQALDPGYLGVVETLSQAVQAADHVPDMCQPRLAGDLCSLPHW